MSNYEPKVGDRVRILVEDELSSVTAGTLDYYSANAGFYINREHVGSVEKIEPPLPTTPGSVIRHSVDQIRVRTEAGWIDPASARKDEVYPDSCYVRNLRRDPVEILFDAGANP